LIAQQALTPGTEQAGAAAGLGSQAQSWLFQFPPLSGESLSSVIDRNADANVVSVATYLRHAGLERRLADLDRGDTEVELAFARALQLDVDALVALTLRPFVGHTLVDLPAKGACAWVIGAGSSVLATPVVCLTCCAQARHWYRRVEWRLGYVTHCSVHVVPLLDACPGCGETLEGRASGGTVGRERQWSLADVRGSGDEASAFDRSCCARCGLSWASILGEVSAAPMAASGWARFQNALLAVPNDGQAPSAWAALDCTFGYQFLAGVRFLLSLLRSPRTGARLRTQLAQRLDVPEELLRGGGRRAQPFEGYTLTQRLASLEAVALLLGSGIEGLVDQLGRASITASVVTQVELYVPYWIASPLRSHLDRSRYSFSAQEVAAARRVAAKTALKDADAPLSPDFGAAITKVALARLTGSRDSQALDRALGRRRRRYERQEAISLFTRLLPMVAWVPRSRTQRTVALRTVLLMMAVAVSCERLEVLCATPGVSESVAGAIEQLPLTLRSGFLTTLREQGYTRNLNELLQSRFGEPLRGASTRLAAAKLLARHGSPLVWNSIDALSGSLRYEHTNCQSAVAQTAPASRVGTL
jgi:hypothetical protein